MFGNNTYPQRIRRRSNLGHIFRGKKVRLMGREIQYYGVKQDRQSRTARSFSESLCPRRDCHISEQGFTSSGRRRLEPLEKHTVITLH